MARTYKPKAVLNKLVFSPHENPLLEPHEVRVKRRYVRTSRASELVDPLTGQVEAVAAIHTVEERDDAEFVKVYRAGVKASHQLTRTADRVFGAVLDAYQQTPMTGGFAESVYLAWFDGGLSGQAVGMSEETFKKGLRELLDKGFLWPKAPNVFWVNPNLFFKGDRVAFITEYRRKASTRSADEAERAALERNGQQRLTD